MFQGSGVVAWRRKAPAMLGLRSAGYGYGTAVIGRGGLIDVATGKKHATIVVPTGPLVSVVALPERDLGMGASDGSDVERGVDDAVSVDSVIAVNRLFTIQGVVGV